MLLCISGQSSGASTEAPATSIARVSLFVIVVAIFNNYCALAVLPLQGMLVGGKNVFRLFKSDDLNRFAHQAKCVSEITHVLVVRVEWSHRADAGPNNYLWTIAARRHERQFVQMANKL